MEKRQLRKTLNDLIFNLARYTEIILSLFILVTIIFLIARLVYDLGNSFGSEMDSGYFNSFLSNALSLVVGIEFVKMLCKHTPETLIEVLMFATARQMVVEHLATWQTLVGVLAIAILFAVRKHLFLSAVESAKITDKF